MVRKAYGKSRRRKKPSQSPFLDKGLSALLLGFACLLISWLLTSHPLLAGAAHVVQTPAWFILGVGVLLLGLHYVLKDKATEEDAPHSEAPLPTSDRKASHRTRRGPVAVPDAARVQAPKLSVVPASTPDATAPKATASPNTAAPAPSSAPSTATWNAEVFKAIEWRRFEAVCEALFSQAGLETKSQSHGPDGGVDLWLYSQHLQGPARVVQCKHWQSRAVGVKELREFFGVMSSHQLKRGTFATTSSFTREAQTFARSNGIHLLDGKALLELIAQRTPEQQQALLAVAYEGEYMRPTCASCGIKMVERVSSQGGVRFWGCTNYPRCRTRMGQARQAS